MEVYWRHSPTLAPQQERVAWGVLLQAAPSGPLARVGTFPGLAMPPWMDFYQIRAFYICMNIQGVLQPY